MVPCNAMMVAHCWATTVMVALVKEVKDKLSTWKSGVSDRQAGFPPRGLISLWYLFAWFVIYNICVLLPVFTFHIFASIFSTSLIIRSPSNSAPEKRSCHCAMIVELAGFDRTIIKAPKGYSSYFQLSPMIAQY